MDKKRKTIAYITPFIWGDVSLSYFKGVLEVAKEQKADIVCYIGNRLGDKENYLNQANQVYHLMDETWIDGLVAWASHLTEVIDGEEQNHLKDWLIDVPMVSISGQIGDETIVLGNNNEVIHMLMKHLVEVHQYKNIGFIRGRKGHVLAERRYQAFLDEMERYKLKVNEDYVSDCYPFKYESGIMAFEEFYQRLGSEGMKEIDAIICVSDALSISFIKEMEKVGLFVPQDIAIVSVNNKADSHMTSAPLTTVDPQHKVTGRKALEVLLAELSGEEIEKEYLIEQMLIVRQSCGCNENSYTYKMNLAEGDKKTFFEQELYDQIEEILYKGLRNNGVYNLRQYCIKVAQAFMNDLIDYDSQEFIRFVKQGLNDLKEKDEDISSWKSTIEKIRNVAFEAVVEVRQQLRCHDLCNHAISEIVQATEYQFAKYKSQTDTKVYNLDQSAVSLRSTFDLAELYDLIEANLEKINIPNCYIVTYDDPEKFEVSNASISFAYKNGWRHKIQENWLGFNPKKLLPNELKHSKVEAVYIVQALYFREMMIGYVVFEGGPIDKSLYQILSGEISSAIYRSRIFKTLIDSEKEREELLVALENKNQNLEKTVEERTKDLSQVNQQLELAVEKANKASQAKSRFLANVSHEIRTPLNCIIGFADMIQEESKNETISRYINLTIEEAEKLLLLINQLLELSKIEAGKILLSNDGIDLEFLMESLASTYSVVTYKKGLSYSYHIGEKVPWVIKGDSLRLRQILVNLIGNAVKFTEEGGIEVGVKCVEDCSRLRFSIHDTGIGIEQERMDAIFSVFEQESVVTSLTYGGSGLGTSISKELVELMGGKIGVDSIKGEGSTFWFEIPFEVMEGEELETFKKSLNMSVHHGEIDRIADFSHKHILIVEDYPPNRMLALAYLAPLGCQCSVAVDGQEALEMMNKHKFDLILMDVQMPRLNGVEATKIIRSDKSLDNTIIIGITANAFESDLRNYKAIGMNDVLTKPFRKVMMQNIVSDWLEIDEPMKDWEVSYKSDVKKENAPMRYEELLNDLDGDWKFLNELVTDFLKYTKVQLEELEEVIHKSDMDLVGKLAHTIKGAALNITASEIGETAGRIEEEARINYSKNMKRMLETLCEQLRELKTFFIEEYNK